MVVKEAFQLTGDMNVLVFCGWNEYTLEAGDVLSDGIKEYIITSFTPNPISNTLSIYVNCENFDPKELTGVALSVNKPKLLNTA